MTEDQKYEIAILADDYAAKKLAFECLGMRNTIGLTPSEAAELDIQYHLADAERIEALGRLESAKRKLAQP